MLQSRIQRMDSFDVIVCGGGPAGFTAAVAAARLGCRTALLERYGMLGGAMTVGGVPAPALFHAWGKLVIKGIGWELMERLAEAGWATLPDPSTPKRHPEMAVKVNAPMAAWLMDKMSQEAKVELFFHQPVVEVLGRDKSLEAVVISTKSGLQLLEGKVFIDCTGDGDIAAWAGADYELGAELQPGTLGFYLKGSADVDSEKLNKSYMEAREKGLILHGDFWGENGRNAVTILRGLNVNHVVFNGADSRSRTKAELAGRESVARISHWLRDFESEFQPIIIAPEVWARESRRIIGEAYITVDDYLEAKAGPDAVCHSFYPIDQHTTDKKNTIKNIFLEEGKVPSIPYGALVPKGFKNLLVAGRCISGDRLAQSAFRVQASCMAMGQAAGTAAYLALTDNCAVGEIDLQQLRGVLAEKGAIVPEVAS